MLRKCHAVRTAHGVCALESSSIAHASFGEQLLNRDKVILFYDRKKKIVTLQRVKLDRPVKFIVSCLPQPPLQKEEAGHETSLQISLSGP